MSSVAGAGFGALRVFFGAEGSWTVARLSCFYQLIDVGGVLVSETIRILKPCQTVW